jgi:septal ring factor EnvC (AmiA/AmiB activator)
MKKVLKIIAVSVVSLIIILCVFSCGGDAVTQEEYDTIKAKLSEAETKLADTEAQIAELKVKLGDPAQKLREQSLNDEIASLKAEIEELGGKITELDEQNYILTQDKAYLEDQYAELNEKYSEAQETLAALEQPETITEEAVEAEILRLLNEERLNAGLPEFIVGKNIYNEAKQNSREMAATGREETSSLVFYQDIFWAAGYDSVESVAHGALITWKLNEYRFEHGPLLPSHTYGAVGAAISGEVVYITLAAASHQ